MSRFLSSGSDTYPTLTLYSSPGEDNTLVDFLQSQIIPLLPGRILLWAESPAHTLLLGRVRVKQLPEVIKIIV